MGYHPCRCRCVEARTALVGPILKLTHHPISTIELARSQLLSPTSRVADAVSVLLRRSLLRHPGALIITTLAASDLAYRLLLREAVRRALGVRH
jgi:hypothetical protein